MSGSTEKIDFKADQIKEAVVTISEPEGRENTRSLIAYILIFLLLVVILCTYGLIAMKFLNINEAKEILIILVGPLVSLIGAVTGFYFGGMNAASN